jgi:hypothetical protein
MRSPSTVTSIFIRFRSKPVFHFPPFHNAHPKVSIAEVSGKCNLKKVLLAVKD